MTALTRRRGNNPHEESWQIYFTDVRTGTIGARAGVPIHADQWGWSIGFYRGMEPGTWRSGIAATFEAAREALMRCVCGTTFAAGNRLRATRTEHTSPRERPMGHADEAHRRTTLCRPGGGRAQAGRTRNQRQMPRGASNLTLSFGTMI